MSQRRLTAAELLHRLENDPEAAAMRRARDVQHQKRVAFLREAEEPLLDELSAGGLRIGSVWELVNTQAKYTSALPVLLAHVSRPYPSPVREGIARALGVPEAISHWAMLIRLYQLEKDPRVKDGLAIAIAGAADESVLDDVAALASNPKHGSSRVLLLSAFARSRAPRVERDLKRLAADPQLSREVGAILARMN
jgi:hypothetical protein